MKLYMIRHGQTDWNVERRIQGLTDIELNYEGIKQASEAAKKLADTKIDLIICSPLKRAKKTAEIINKNRKIEMIFDDRIVERCFGEFEGLCKDNFECEEFWNYKMNKKYEKAENVQDFFKRVYEFIDEIKEKYPEKSVLLVSHGGVSIPFRCYFEGISESEEILKSGFPNCRCIEYEL